MLIRGGVVESDDVLDLLGALDAGEGVDARAILAVAVDLRAAAQRQVGVAHGSEVAEGLVQRVGRVEVVVGRGGIGADQVLVHVVRHLAGQHVLAAQLVAAAAGEALLVAVVDDREAASEEEQPVAQLHARHQLGVRRVGQRLLQGVAQPAQVVVADEGSRVDRRCYPRR